MLNTPEAFGWDGKREVVFLHCYLIYLILSQSCHETLSNHQKRKRNYCNDVKLSSSYSSEQEKKHSTEQSLEYVPVYEKQLCWDVIHVSQNSPALHYRCECLSEPLQVSGSLTCRAVFCVGLLSLGRPCLSCVSRSFPFYRGKAFCCTDVSLFVYPSPR